MHVDRTVQQRVAIIRFTSPPVNALSIANGLVAGLAAEIDQVNALENIDAIVLAGSAGTFSAGADIKEFDHDRSRLDVSRALFERVAASRYPVVAAIDGTCLGGGFELALACTWRVGTASARIGLPEVTLGLLPGGGGTQRLPRLIEPGAALDLMLTGTILDADKAARVGILDAIIAGDVIAGAIEWLQTSGAQPHREVSATSKIAAAVHARGDVRGVAQRAILACVEAAGTLPLAEGLAIEARLFDGLLDSPESLARRYAFAARRIAARPPLGVDGIAHPLQSVLILGAGTMGIGIATAMINAGIDTQLFDPLDGALDRGQRTIASTLEREVTKQRLSANERDVRLARLGMVTDLEAARPADLYIEAVFEDLSVKKDVFETLDRLAPEGALLASNTSTLNLDVIAGFTKRPADVVGLHFFSPANIMPLLEVVRGAKTSPATVATAMAFAKRIRKQGVVSGVCDGFIGNRMFEEYLRQSYFLLEEGALPQQIDQALERWGMAMGPCRVLDLAGQDIGWSVRKRRALEQPDRPYSRIPDMLCEMGRFGQKCGAGFYRYSNGRTAEPDPEIDALIVAHSAAIGVTRRAISEEEIVERCIYALINEGARILDEGIAYRPSDIDVVYLDGYGFPADRGGPMYEADRVGLPAVVSRMRAFAQLRQGWAWQPASLLLELIEQRGNFSALNASA